MLTKADWWKKLSFLHSSICLSSEPLSEVPVTPVSLTPAPGLCLSCAVPRVCAAVVKCALLLSVHGCKNKQDLRGFQHCGDQLEQSSPISAGKGRCHAALSETKGAAADVRPCKSLTAERWKLIQKFAEKKELVA